MIPQYSNQAFVSRLSNRDVLIQYATRKIQRANQNGTKPRDTSEDKPSALQKLMESGASRILMTKAASASAQTSSAPVFKSWKTTPRNQTPRPQSHPGTVLEVKGTWPSHSGSNSSERLTPVNSGVHVAPSDVLPPGSSIAVARCPAA